ncbi:MAG: autotransporter-associated beta strand repeat-containing protein [Verrucomicrobiae bacterium]|nr:autotransporter-associated beta strand repeat-containing protein [Verrucomicrobiae bacterium]
MSWSGGGGANAYWNNGANWGFAGVPGNGDTLIFPASQPNELNTNNIVGLVLNQIRFAGGGGGYDIRGNTFTLTNSIWATNTTGANVIEPAMVLATGTITMVVSNGASLTLDGNLTGSVGVTKTGLGILLYQAHGNNTYAGTTLVAGGTLQLNCSGVNAISGPLVIGDGTGAGSPTVTDLQPAELENLPSVSINLNGTLNLNNFNEPTLTPNLTMSGGTISTGTDQLIMPANSIITLANNYSDFIYGNFNAGSGTLTIQGVGAGSYLYVYANVSGFAKIVQTDVNTIWYGANTFTGDYLANGAGFVDLVGSQVLGNPTNNLTINGQTYILIYGQVDLTNQSLTLNSTNGLYQVFVYGPSTNSSWHANFTNNAGLTIDLIPNAVLNLAGPISGPGFLMETNLGTLTLSGNTANTYAGTTTVAGGTLQLGKGYATTSVPNLLVVNTNSTVRLLNSFQIDSTTTPVAMADSSVFDLGVFTDAVGPLSLQGAKVNAASGFIYLCGNITVNASTVAQSVINGFGSIFGSIITITNIGHNYSPDLVISASLISGGATNGLVKAGGGEVALAGNNSFTGPVTINGGDLWAETSTALGGTNVPATVNSGGTLFLFGTGLDFGLKPLVLNGSGYAFGAVSCQGSSSWEGTVTLASDSTVYQFATSSLTLNGTVNGVGSYIKAGPGTNTFAGTGFNPYAGQTFVNDGTLNLSKAGYSIGFGTLNIGDGIGSAASAVVREFNNSQIAGSSVIMNSDGFLDINGHSDLIGPTVTLNGGANIQNFGSSTLTLEDGTTVTVNSGISSIWWGNLSVGSTNTTCTWVVATNADLFFDTTVVGAAKIVSSGPGLVSLGISNSFSGPLLIQQGSIWLGNSFSLGATNNGVVVSSFASLVLDGGMGVTNKTVTLNGPGEYGTYGALDSEYGTNIWAGPIVINGNCTFDAWKPTDQLHVRGPITGPGSLEVFGYPGGGGIHFFEGAAANAYAGQTWVDNGSTLVLNKSILYNTVSNVVVVGTLRLGNNEQIAPGADVLTYLGSLFDFGPFYQDINTLRGEGNVTFGAGGYLAIGASGGTSQYDGPMSGPGFSGGYTVGKYGSGTFTMTANNTYQNGSYAYGGELIIDGNQPQSPVYVNSGATLGGVGTVGTILAYGSVNPGYDNGLNFGTLSSSNVTFSSSGNFTVQINGPTPGSDYEQLNVAGTNTLANATLGLNLAFTSPVAVGQQFTIINNDGTDPISGIFLGYPEGTTFVQNGYAVKISYVGGTGNDVVLTLATIPGAVSGSTVTAGDGSHAIDPNGCNNLSLAITNTSGAPMTGVAATLSTTTEGVVITQPYTTYPNIPANGNGTNVTPFQVSVLPSFACGSPINLQLVVNSSLGAFTINYVLGSGEPSPVPARYDVSGDVAIPDVGSVNSTNVVSGFAAMPLVKVVASLYLTHPYDSDLTNISLISPDGTTVLLSSANGGSGQNYGSGLTPDANRTTFDDAASTSITSGVAPFAGTFRPQSPLSAFSGNATPNGNWRLHIADGFGGSLGTLRGWSLFLYGTSCSPGGGTCDDCLTSISGSITNTDLVETNRVSRNLIVASCGSPKVFPGFTSGNFHYRAYAFTNTSPNEACVTVTTTSAADAETVAYFGDFNPLNVTNNYYYGDPGYSTGNSPTFGLNGPTTFSFSVPPGWPFSVVVNEINPGAGVGPYTLQLSGLPCPPPTLNIQPVAPGKARLYWDTSAGGYVLEADSNLVNNVWGSVTNEPIVTGGNYSVTNSAVLPNNQFYRLHKP